MFALFIAGGSGTRLYPLSRTKKPKQLHSLIGKTPLIAKTIERVSPVIQPKNIWVVTNRNHVKQVSDVIPSVPRRQIIAEPYPLGTCSAVGLGLLHIARENPKAAVVIGWADAHIGKEREFRWALSEAERVARKTEGVILGSKPESPSVEYGYLKRGDSLTDADGFHYIEKFEEKPSERTAQQFYDDGDYLWNTGITVWKVKSLLNLMGKYAPLHYAVLMEASRCLGKSGWEDVIEKGFRDLDKVAIDHAIFEKAKGLVAFSVDLDWSDIGSWSAVYELEKKSADEKRNVTKGRVVSVNTKDSLIYSKEKLIATLGISDLVIVESDDVVLVTTKKDAGKLKKLHSQIEKTYGKKFS